MILCVRRKTIGAADKRHRFVVSRVRATLFCMERIGRGFHDASMVLSSMGILRRAPSHGCHLALVHVSKPQFGRTETRRLSSGGWANMRRFKGMDWVLVGGLAAGIASFGLVTVAILTMS